MKSKENQQEPKELQILKIAIDALKKNDENLTRWNKTFQEMFDGHIVPQFDSPLTSAICKMIEILFNDHDEEYGSTFSWWIWEQNFGKNAKVWDENKKEIPLKTPEQLYDFYIEYYKDKENEKN